MYSRFLGRLILLLAVQVPVLCAGHAALGQTDEEMLVLTMFYREKDLVVISPTRHPKPLSSAAENMTVVTAEEIEAMNAHSVAEVLSRVPGIFVSFSQGLGNLGSTSLPLIQGSEARHVLVLVDGIRWNLLSDGAAETNSIPLGMVERIEIIKGPASSAWGSSLGGVVNIITKPAGDAKRPAGSLGGSYGKEATRDLRGEVAGRAGPLGYYLFAGHQASDGLEGDRDFERTGLYSKIALPLGEGGEVTLTGGYSDPRLKLGDYASQDLLSRGAVRARFATASLRAPLSRRLSLDLAVHRFEQKAVVDNRALGLGFLGPRGDLFQASVFDQDTTGGHGQVVWEKGGHTAVLGADFEWGKLEQRIEAGPLLQFMGVPAASLSCPDMDRWALYANDTFVFHSFSLSLGLRYDQNSVTDGFLSPSLGLTWRLGEGSILRAAVARGFSAPPLSATSGGALFLDPNPDLDPEEVWSYQVGAESTALRYLWIKATVFRHEVQDVLTRKFAAAGAPSYNDLLVNEGKVRRQGAELEFETLPFHHFSLIGAYGYVHFDPSNEAGSEEIYGLIAGLRYDDRRSFRAELLGRYVWWDYDAAPEAQYDDFIWDLNLSKSFSVCGGSPLEVFFSAHNLLDGSQYTLGDSRNPGRWLEAGIRLRF